MTGARTLAGLQRELDRNRLVTVTGYRAGVMIAERVLAPIDAARMARDLPDAQKAHVSTALLDRECVGVTVLHHADAGAGATFARGA